MGGDPRDESDEQNAHHNCTLETPTHQEHHKSETRNAQPQAGVVQPLGLQQKKRKTPPTQLSTNGLPTTTYHAYFDMLPQPRLCRGEGL
jgi:hypothetical protein